MDRAPDMLDSIYRQIISLKRKGLKPTAIMVGENAFRDFAHSQHAPAIDFVQSALGMHGEPTIMGVRVYRTFEDQSFTVLTDGSPNI